LGFRRGIYKFTVRGDFGYERLIDVNEYPIPENQCAIDARSFPVFFVNLAKHPLFSEDGEVFPADLHETFNLFQTIINSTEFRAPLIILIFTNMSRFRAKGPLSPLGRRLVSNDPDKASLYIRRLFEDQAKARGLRAYSKCGPPGETVPFVRSTVKIATLLSEAGFI
jgi:hypothetical protein